MDDLEIRKTRLNIVFKLFYPFFTVLGALILYFGQTATGKPGFGDTILLGFAAFLIVFILAMICYMFNEMVCFKTAKEETDTAESDKASVSYKNLFKCFVAGGLGLLGYILVLVAIALYQENDFVCVHAPEVHVAIFLVLGLFFSYISPDCFLKISLVGTGQTQGVPDDGSVPLPEKKLAFFNLSRFSQGRWAAWSIFVFHLLYYVWFK